MGSEVSPKDGAAAAALADILEGSMWPLAVGDTERFAVACAAGRLG